MVIFPLCNKESDPLEFCTECTQRTNGGANNRKKEESHYQEQQRWTNPYCHLPLGNQTDLTLDHGNLPKNEESDPLNICTECTERTNGRAKN